MQEILDNIEWFKREIAPVLKNYELNYRVFGQGDLGSLDQVEFNSTSTGGNIDFGSKGWLGIFVWSYSEEKELLNILIGPNECEKKNTALDELKRLLL